MSGHGKVEKKVGQKGVAFSISMLVTLNYFILNPYSCVIKTFTQDFVSSVFLIVTSKYI